jgi:c-di-GMP-binding flagellar brake protein YcgR
MLSELITQFTAAHQNRRKYARRAGPFPAWVATGNTWTPVICLDLSGSGLGIVSAGALGEESNFRMQLEHRNILIRAKRVWQQPGTTEGKPAWRYGLTFTRISADDWDALVRFCAGGDVPVEDKA